MQNLAKYEAAWLNQIEQYKERMTKVYDISSITSISEFDLLRNEVISLMRIYAGQEQDVEDLKMVLKQIDLIQNDFNRLSNDDLSEEELEVAYTQALTEIEKEFESDTPPLDTELIFEGIMKLINERRRASSNNWVKLNVPSIKDLKQYNSNKLQEVRWRLKNVPKILSTEHRKMVQDVLLYCEKQLDEYEIEGLIVRFKDMNREKRQSFLERLLEIVDDEDFRRKFYNYRN
jgi:predicted RND superfamily exporter protein